MVSMPLGGSDEFIKICLLVIYYYIVLAQVGNVCSDLGKVKRIRNSSLQYCSFFFLCPQQT